MTRKWLGLMLAMSLAAAVAGCGGGSGGGGDPAASYRAAIPPAETVAAAEPQTAAAGRTLASVGEPAYFPQLGIPVAQSVNGVVTGLFDVMRDLVKLPPAHLDPDNGIAAWGPFDDPGGDIVVVIMKAPADVVGFEYLYGFLRVPEGWDQDLETATRVIVGFSNPNAPTGPNGLFFIDFDADSGLTEGGFAAAYAQLPVTPATPEDVGGILTFVVAAFRDFVPEETPEADPANVDYLYGHFVMADEAATTVDFLEFATAADIDDGGLAESLDVRMAFLNGGWGRAEATVSGGDLGEVTGNAVECWNDQILQVYGEMTGSSPEGALEDAGLFANSLDELGIPSLEWYNSQGDLLSVLGDFATCGDSPCVE